MLNAIICNIYRSFTYLLKLHNHTHIACCCIRWSTVGNWRASKGHRGINMPIVNVIYGTRILHFLLKQGSGQFYRFCHNYFTDTIFLHAIAPVPIKPPLMHHNDVIISSMASQITSLTSVYSNMNSPKKGPVTGKIFHLMASSRIWLIKSYSVLEIYQKTT